MKRTAKKLLLSSFIFVDRKKTMYILILTFTQNEKPSFHHKHLKRCKESPFYKTKKNGRKEKSFPNCWEYNWAMKGSRGERGTVGQGWGMGYSRTGLGNGARGMMDYDSRQQWFWFLPSSLEGIIKIARRGNKFSRHYLPFSHLLFVQRKDFWEYVTKGTRWEKEKRV